MRTITDALSPITCELQECLGKIFPGPCSRFIDQILDAQRIFLTGTGRSALAIRGFAMRLMHMGIEAYLIGDANTPPIRGGDLLIVGSGSGTTPSLIVQGRRAVEFGAKIVLVTANPKSPLAEIAAAVVEIPAPTPKSSENPGRNVSIQPMGSLFEQCLFLFFDASVLVLMERKVITATDMFRRHANLE